MINFLIITEVIIGILLITIILLQNKQSSLNLASMGGGMGEVTKRGADKVLHNTTIIFGSIFIIISVLLFIAS